LGRRTRTLRLEIQLLRQSEKLDALRRTTAFETTPMSPTPGSELRDYLTILWRRRASIIAITLAVFGVTMFYASRQIPTYVSSADVLIRPVTVSLPQLAPQPVVIENEQRIATSGLVSSIAQGQLGDRAPASIAVEIATGAQILQFVSESASPRSAQATAEAYAAAYVEQRRDSVTDEVDAARDLIEDRITALEVESDTLRQQLLAAETQGEIALLQIRLSSLSTELTDARGQLSEIPPPESIDVGEVIERAGLPTEPASPDFEKLGALGLFVGLSLGVGLAFLRERLRQPLRNREDLEEAVGAPLVAMVPPSYGDGGDIVVIDDSDSAPADAYRALRARVAFAMSRSGIRSLLVTSPHSDDGKTTTAINLAAALAEIGKRVVLVLADLRMPAPRRFVARMDGVGLSSVLEGHADVRSALVETGIDNLTVLMDPEPIPKSADLVGSRRMNSLLDTLGQRADIVIVDTTPLLGPADAVNIAQFADAVLLVADGRKRTRAEIREAAIELRSVDADILGVVLTHVRGRTFAPYLYRHGYYRAEPAQEVDSSTPAGSADPDVGSARSEG
jgi:capsular exopolysaccharide synthesis family protein